MKGLTNAVWFISKKLSMAAISLEVRIGSRCTKFSIFFWSFNSWPLNVSRDVVEVAGKLQIEAADKLQVEAADKLQAEAADKSQVEAADKLQAEEFLAAAFFAFNLYFNNCIFMSVMNILKHG